MYVCVCVADGDSFGVLVRGNHEFGEIEGGLLLSEFRATDSLLVERGGGDSCVSECMHMERR